MSERSDESDQSFRVHDRRRFDAEGNLKPAEGQAETEPDAPASSPPPPPEPPRAEPEPEPAAAPAEGEAGTVGFSELVLSIATNALAFLGREGPGEEGTVDAPKVNLRLASQNIDILAMLETKTRGNLTKAESDLLTSVLYDLRTLYVETAKVIGQQPG
jgi:hypothetical protein